MSGICPARNNIETSPDGEFGHEPLRNKSGLAIQTTDMFLNDESQSDWLLMGVCQHCLAVVAFRVSELS